MFAKLLKYDMRSLKKIGVPILLVLLVLAIVSSILGYATVAYLDRVGADPNPSEFTSMMMTMLILLLSLGTPMVFSLFAAAALVMTIFVFVRFYKNLVSDEGYLTFTLPVTSNQIIMSKLTSGFVWTSVVSVAAIVAIVLVVIISMLGIGGNTIDMEGFGEILNGLKIDFGDVPFGAVTIGVQVLVFLVVSLVFNLLLTFMAIFLGSVISKKAKALASVGCVLGINFVLSIVTRVFSSLFLLLFAGVETVEDLITRVNITLLVNNVVYIGAAVGCYFLLKHMMDKKLNLN